MVVRSIQCFDKNLTPQQGITMERVEKANPTVTVQVAKKERRYTGPVKGSVEAKERMARVRAAQYAKNGLVYTTK